MMNSKEFNIRIVSLSPRIYPMVARLLENDEEAVDAVQEIMIRLWKNRGKLGNHPNPEGYVFLTARNYCLDLLKKQNPAKNQISLDGNSLASMTGNENYEQKELFRIVTDIINELPVSQRDIIMMRDIDGLEFNEIMEITGTRIENIRVSLSRARRKIGTRLNDIYNYEYGTIKQAGRPL